MYTYTVAAAADLISNVFSSFFFFSEIFRLQSGGSRSGGGYKDPIKYVDVYRERPIRLTVRVLVPVREHPKVLPPLRN